MASGEYSFLPWLRRGISNEIRQAASARSRATIEVTASAGDGVSTKSSDPHTFELVGPGDVIGIDPQNIVRCEPRNWVTDFEPNFLPFVEFYDEDFPWRYSPLAPEPATHRALPWLTLLVLEEGEFERNPPIGGPLTSIKIKRPNADELFAPPDQAWAWAHVQIAESMGDGAAPNADQLRDTLQTHPDRGLSRVFSARRLQPETPYFAFLVPTFEVGRKAGLGIKFDDQAASGLEISWQTGAEFPVYFEWYFRTGKAGDFEELATRLKPRPVDPRVGIRDMDIAAPRFGMPDVVPPVGEDHHKGVVGLEGALKSPTMQPKPLDPQSTFPVDVAAIVNTKADAQREGEGDPVVAPPFHGGWHVLLDRVDPAPANEGWPHVLNRDARLRASAGLGARVIRQNQDDYMRQAWSQIGEILAANRKIHLLQYAQAASQFQFDKSVAALPEARAFVFSAPVHARVRGSPQTIRKLVEESRLPAAALSGPMRKLLRPRGPLAVRALPRIVRSDAVASVAIGLNEGRLSTDPPRPPVAGPTLEQIGETATPAGIRLTLARLILLLALLALIVVLAFVFLGVVAAIAIAVAAIAAAAWLVREFLRQRREADVAQALNVARLTPAAVNAVDIPDDFRITEPGAPPPTTPPPPDPVPAARFQQELASFAGLLAAEVPPAPPRAAVDIANARAKTITAITPIVAFPRMATARIAIGGRPLVAYSRDVFVRRLADTTHERIVPVMAYPDIKEGMYKPLADMGDELLVPNLGLVPPNTISLMLTNQPFIEAYMVGLNNEFAGELLWREYPTDQRGSPFRQFWSVQGIPAEPGLAEALRAEKLKDIPPVHMWLPETAIGTHNHRVAASAGERIVLTIRGDLLKRYPNTIIYAQAAAWGTGDRQNELVLYDEDGARAAANLNDPNIKFPMFKAQVTPDLHFIGFDLSLDTVRGHKDLEETAEARTTIPADQLGWFFVLQEMVGEPRFGLDEERPDEARDRVWDNLAWENIDLAGKLVVDLARPFILPLGGTQTDGLAWGSNAADMAAILYQKPVMIAVHGREMLDRNAFPEGG
ncbi:MAG: hypothetical protein ACRC67_41065 [Inquilinus sp.]|uniref:hypothetical protein n=1 Tax=Inquilinus sp. TaxID=1932117 RepID=UPI003F320438